MISINLIDRNRKVIMQCLFVFVLTALIVSACGQGQSQTPTPTPAFTETPSPTFTPLPTITPTPTFTLTPTPSIGSTTISDKDGMVMVFVPAGEFTMGSKLYGDERPAHQVYLDGYWIDRTEVTNKMFVDYLNEIASQVSVQDQDDVSLNDTVIFSLTCAACRRWKDRITWDGSRFSAVAGYENHPVLLVSWDGANSYCSWAGRRLPTEAEWEKAARGTDGRTYPWGEGTPNASLLNFNNNVGDTTEVGSYLEGASVFGALDMSGNVWEWVNDWYDENYYKTSPSSNPPGPDSGTHKVIRGNGWYDIFSDVRSALRSRFFPKTTFDNLGFRCARSQ